MCVILWFCLFKGIGTILLVVLYPAAFTQHHPAGIFPCVTAGNKWCTQQGYCYQSSYSQKWGQSERSQQGFWSIQILGGDCYYFKTHLRAGAVDEGLPHRSNTRKHREWEALLGFTSLSPTSPPSCRISWWLDWTQQEARGPGRQGKSVEVSLLSHREGKRRVTNGSGRPAENIQHFSWCHANPTCRRTSLSFWCSYWPFSHLII